MKLKVIKAFLFCLISISTLYSQIPNGATAPDFTLTDINGETWNLYTLLEEGKTVILDVSSTWCGPCWNWHTQGILEQLYHNFGPEGTLSQDLMIFLIEVDEDSDMSDLQGTGSSTLGDWITGTPYPIIDLPDELTVDIFKDNWGIFGLPEAFVVCPSKKAFHSDDNYTSVAQGTYVEILKVFNYAACIGEHDAMALRATGSGIECNTDFTPGFTLRNNGTETLTSCSISYNLEGEDVITVEWSGSLAPEEEEDINLAALPTPSTGLYDLYISVNAPNGYTDENTINNSVKYSFISTVSGNGASLPFGEGFGANTIPSYILQGEQNYLWAPSYRYGGYSQSPSCLWNNKFGWFEEISNEFTFKGLDFTGQTDIYLRFDLAHTLWSFDHPGYLRVLVSTDCGAIWEEVYYKTGTELRTTDKIGWAFKPYSYQWRTECIDLSAFAGESNVLIKFVDPLVSSGNNTYIDNVIVDAACDTQVDSKEYNDNQNTLSIYPNPTSDFLQLELSGPIPIDQVIITDVNGKMVKSGAFAPQISIADLAKGVYTVTIISEQGSEGHFFIKQ